MSPAIVYLMITAEGAAAAFLLALAVNEYCAWRGIPRRQGFCVRTDHDE